MSGVAAFFARIRRDDADRARREAIERLHALREGIGFLDLEKGFEEALCEDLGEIIALLDGGTS